MGTASAPTRNERIEIARSRYEQDRFYNCVRAVALLENLMDPDPVVSQDPKLQQDLDIKAHNLEVTIASYYH